MYVLVMLLCGRIISHHPASLLNFVVRIFNSSSSQFVIVPFFTSKYISFCHSPARNTIYLFTILVYRRTYWFLVPHFNFPLIFINLLHQFLQNVPTHLQIVSMPPPLRIYNSVPIYILYSLNPAPGILLAIFSACCV